MRYIYHITSGSAWEAAQKDGHYSAPSLEAEGFIHASKITQVLLVANALYADLPSAILLEVDVNALEAPLKWESAIHPDGYQGGAVPDEMIFPHIYGKINLSAVVQVDRLPRDAGGEYLLPERLR